MNNIENYFDNLKELSRGWHPLEKVIELTGITNVNTQPQSKTEFAEEHVEGEIYEQAIR